MLEEDIRISISVLISPFPQLFHKGAKTMCPKNLFFLIPLLLLPTLTAGQALDRITDGNDVASWQPAAPSPGS